MLTAVVRASEVVLQWVGAPDQMGHDTREQLMRCWRDVSNAGGAVGFPFLPVGDEQVRPAVEEMVSALGRDSNRLLTAAVDDALVGWLLLSLNTNPLTQHWARVLRVQTALEYRGRGLGRALMHEVARSARDDIGVEQLHLELRSGLGLEDFYSGLGWQVTGRWPGALRLSEHDRRDEVLMLLDLAQPGSGQLCQSG